MLALISRSSFKRECHVSENHRESADYFRAMTSAATTRGFLVLALRDSRRIVASRKPAASNSFRKVTPSLAPAIHANQFGSLA